MHSQVDKENLSRPRIMQNGNLVQKQSLEKKKSWLTQDKHFFVHLPKIHDKSFRFYPVNTERTVGGGKEAEAPYAKISLILLNT
jgi:hypothetical protein